MQDFHEEAKRLIKEERTVYDVTPLKVESKWEVPQMPGKYYTGTVFHIIKTISGGKYIGVSHCIAIDEFDPERGKEIATGRALKAVNAGECVFAPGEDTGLQEVSVFTRDGTGYRGYVLQ